MSLHVGVYHGKFQKTQFFLLTVLVGYFANHAERQIINNFANHAERQIINNFD